MKESADQVEMVFKCNRDEIPGMLNVSMAHIKTKTQDYQQDESVMSRIKWVVTELLTNAVKHSGQLDSVLKIAVEDHKLIVEKEDSGLPLTLVGQDNITLTWPLPGDKHLTDFQIYHNGMDSLCVRTTVEGNLVFFITQLDDIAMPGLLADTSEHFGLLIMTKAADELMYRYDQDSHTNHFVTSFHLTSARDEA